LDELILVANDCERTVGTLQPVGGVARAYDVLVECSYEFTEAELHAEVARHRGKQDLRTETYMLKRNKLLKHWGWGLHRRAGRIGMVACESEEYSRLLESPLVKKTRAYNSQRTL